MTETKSHYDYRAAAASDLLHGINWREGELSLTAAPPAARFNLRGDAEFCRTLCAEISLTPPPKMLMTSQNGGDAVLWLGPDEYYLYVEDEHKAATLAAQATASLSNGSVVDNSHRFIGIKVKGENAADLLMSYCPLNLSLAAFPIGKTTRSLWGKIDVLLWRRSTGEFQIEIARSFANYAVRLLDFAHQNQTGLQELDISAPH